MKTETTKELESAIWKVTQKQGVFCCFEVTIGWFGKERVDYMTYDTNGVWRCYEIKASKSDFHSKASVTFVGHYNYFVLTKELYEQVKNEIPPDIGAYADGALVKRPRRRGLAVDEQTLKNSMIRSLYRYAEYQYKSETPTIVEYYKRENDRLERENRRLKKDNYENNLELRARQRADRKGIKFDLDEWEREMSGLLKY